MEQENIFSQRSALLSHMILACLVINNLVFVQKMNISIDYVQIMNNNSNIVKMNQEQLDILRKLSKKPNISQRELASDLGISLGKLNYVLNELKTKGLVKISNFKKNPNKIKYLYLLTPKGISEKTKLTVNFMKKKLREYDELKKEIENIKK